MKDEFYKTTMNLDVTVATQFGPEDAISLVQNLLRVPAVESVILRGIESNYIPKSKKDANFGALHFLNRKLIDQDPDKK